MSEKSTRNDVDYAAELQNGTELLRFLSRNIVLACKISHEQYNFRDSELKMEIPVICRKSVLLSYLY